MSTIIESLEKALGNNELGKFLMGTGEYNIPNREGLFHDLSVALFSGIYKYCESKPESAINITFEQTIMKMFNGSEFEIMCAFDYAWRQISCEERKTAPFKLSEECLINIKTSMLQNKDILKNYKEYYEFGKELANGAYQYAENINKMLEEEYGRKIL